MKPSTPFETALYRARETGDYAPVWQAFAETGFFIGLRPNEQGGYGQDARFAVYQDGEGGHLVIVSEDAKRLAGTEGTMAAKLTGAQLLPLLNPQLGMAVALDDSGFVMPPGLLARLRSGLQQA